MLDLHQDKDQLLFLWLQIPAVRLRLINRSVLVLVVAMESIVGLPWSHVLRQENSWKSSLKVIHNLHLRILLTLLYATDHTEETTKDGWHKLRGSVTEVVLVITKAPTLCAPHMRFMACQREQATMPVILVLRCQATKAVVQGSVRIGVLLVHLRAPSATTGASVTSISCPTRIVRGPAKKCEPSSSILRYGNFG